MRPHGIGWGLVLLLPLLGCDGSGSSGAGKTSGESGKGTVVSNGGNFAVSFESVPAPIPLNSPFTLKFSVQPKGPAGAAASPLEVEVDARMPAHFHGMNRVPKLVRKPDGTFEAEGMLFHMPGHWELYVDITRAGITERAQVAIELK